MTSSLKLICEFNLKVLNQHSYYYSFSSFVRQGVHSFLLELLSREKSEQALLHSFPNFRLEAAAHQQLQPHSLSRHQFESQTIS